MKKKKSVLAVTLAILTACLQVGCVNQAVKPSAPLQSAEESTHETEAQTEEKAKEPSQDTERKIRVPTMTKEEYPRVDGSTATLPLSTLLYQLVTGADAREAESQITHTKTSNAYEELIYDRKDLLLAYEPAPSVYQYMEDNKVNLIMKPIGKDALVFMANEGNKAVSLTERQIVDIYTGDIRNWADVGGEDKEIMAFQRPVGTGSQTLMEKLVMKGIPMNPEAPQTSVIGEMGELIEAVASYNNEENALGYSVYFYAQNMFVRPGLRFMEVDGVLPSNESIKDGSYPYVNDFYAVIREDEPKDSSAYKLFKFLTTPDGQALIEGVGYVGLKEVPQASRLQLKEDSISGDTGIRFGKDEFLLLDGQYAYGTSGVALLNEKMETEKWIEGVTFSRQIQVVNLNEPIILEVEANLEGIYSLKKDTWLVEPEYSNIYLNEDGTYSGYRKRADGERILMSLSWDGQKFKIREEMEYKIGDRIWNVKEEEKRAVITDLTGTTVKEVNFEEYGSYNYGYIQAPYYIAVYQDTYVIFDSNGEVVFSKEHIDAEFIQQIKNLNPDEETGDRLILYTVSTGGEWIECLYGEPGLPFIYSLKQKKVLTEPGDEITVYTTDKDIYFMVNEELVYSDGTPMVSSDGIPYSYNMGREYYAYQAETGLVVEKTETAERYILPVTNADYVFALADGLFYATTYEGTGTGIYREETCLIEGDRAGWWTHGDRYCIVTGNEDQCMLFDLQGNLLYESDIPESIIEVTDTMLVVIRGNYLYVNDYEGRCAMRLLMGYMGDD